MNYESILLLFVLCDAAIAVDETFQTETVDNNVVVLHYNSLVLGGNNYLHIEYSEKTDTILEHAFFPFFILQILLILVLLIPLPPVQNGLIQQNR